MATKPECEMRTEWEMATDWPMVAGSCRRRFWSTLSVHSLRRWPVPQQQLSTAHFRDDRIGHFPSWIFHPWNSASWTFSPPEIPLSLAHTLDIPPYQGEMSPAKVRVSDRGKCLRKGGKRPRGNCSRENVRGEYSTQKCTTLTNKQCSNAIPQRCLVCRIKMTG